MYYGKLAVPGTSATGENPGVAAAVAILASVLVGGRPAPLVAGRGHDFLRWTGWPSGPFTRPSDRSCATTPAARAWTYVEAERRAAAPGGPPARRAPASAAATGWPSYAPNRSEYVFLFLACIKLGAVLVPLNFRLTPPELAVMLPTADPALLIYDAGLSRPRWPTLRGDGFDLPGLTMDELTRFLAAAGDPGFTARPTRRSSTTW